MYLKPKKIAYALLRLALGINILLHGLVRLIGTSNGAGSFVDATVQLFDKSPLPAQFVQLFATAVPIVESIVGLLLVIGLFTLPALIVGTLLMIAIMAGMCLLQKWDVVGIQLPYILFYVGLIATLEWNGWSLDSEIRRRSKT